MVFYSGLRCPKCRTRIALAVAPEGKAFTCPACNTPMKARRRASLASAMMWCPRCWLIPKHMTAHHCPKCHGAIEPLHLSFSSLREHAKA